MPELEPTFPRSWIEFADPAEPEQLIRADLTWLTSRYNCIFGRGCPGIDAALPAAGCCTHGAHFADDDDEERVATWVDRLTSADWQRRPDGPLRRGDWTESDDEGGRKTRAADGACVLLNDPDFPAGGGCALHLLAQRSGESHVATKPDVCWQLPLRREYEWREANDGEQVLVVTITEYTRAVWGGGGHDFDWYCTSATEAHGAADPLYVSSRAELNALIGPAAYAELSRHCDEHLAARDALRLIGISSGLAPHPADPDEG